MGVSAWRGIVENVAPLPCGHVWPILSTPPHVRSCFELISDLTGRESEVFRLLGMGMDNREISRELGVAERTTRAHMTAVMTKLRLDSRLQAGIVAASVLCWCET
ncbi:helix-turn-helix transcriptional regulator [Kitasatospora sp. NPDC097605]|uniref:helix-turn-helix domain-containing protein n=1 Tax=Kitasatospora sp. NPDC097605 TaxID=3157226 RepID=UPI003327923F